MKPHCSFALIAALAWSAGALAVDAADVSPYDKHPECLATTADGASGNCIIHDEGVPRHRYPPPGPAAMPGNRLGASGQSGAVSSGQSSAPAATNPAEASPQRRR
jgi:hypothetical protein